MTELRRAAMDACLQLSRDAIAIFDALEADQITMETARSVVSMGRRANEVALGVQTMVITGDGIVRR